MSDHAARVERERAFHDERFADDPRGVTGKYYAVDSGKADFKARVGTVAAGATVLELGCGTGSSAFGLAQRGVDVLGIDISQVAIDAARQEAADRGLADHLRFELMDAHRLESPDASFDVVCGSGVLHHLDLSLAVPELARVLRDDGWAVFYEPLGTNPVIRLYRRLTPRLRTEDEHPLLPADFELARRWFTEVDVTPHTALALAGVVVRRLPGGARIVRALDRADEWLFRRVPGARWLAWVAVVRLAAPKRPS